MDKRSSYTDMALVQDLRLETSIDEAIRHLYRTQFNITMAYIKQNNGSEEDAEDIFQEVVLTFIELVKNDKFRGESSVSTFLYALTRNTWLNELKKRGRAKLREEKFERGKETSSIDVSHFIINREMKLQLMQLVASLGETCKKILLAFYFENRAMKEILEILDYENEQVVRNKKYKCLKQLEQMMSAQPTWQKILNPFYCMSENFTNTELLIQFLDGELDEVQRAAIQKSVDENAAIREELEKLKLAKEAIKSYGLKNKVGSIHTEMMNELKKDTAPRTGKIRKLVAYSLRVAAAVFIIISLSVLYQYFSATPGKLFNENFEAFNLHETRGAGLSPLEGLYKNGNMQQVIQQFDTLNDPQPPDYFLAGNALLLNHQAGKAIQTFLALQLKNNTNNTHYYEEDTEYYLALSYLNNNEPAKSVPLFEKIHADKNHPYHKKISTWFLTKLRRLGAAK